MSLRSRNIQPNVVHSIPKLKGRLKVVASEIHSATHVDVGSDHGLLLVSLLESGRIQRGIAIENKQRPFENSVAALRGLNAEVRFSDGLEKLQPDEADSLTICGMGGRSIVRILNAFPDRIPSYVVVQPNRHPELVREWGLQSGFHIVREQILWDRWQYNIICFQKSSVSVDPAYEGLDREAAVMLGPLIIKALDGHLAAKLRLERECLQKHPRRCAMSDRRLAAIATTLAWYQSNRSHCRAL